MLDGMIRVGVRCSVGLLGELHALQLCAFLQYLGKAQGETLSHQIRAVDGILTSWSSGINHQAG